MYISRSEQRSAWHQRRRGYKQQLFVAQQEGSASKPAGRESKECVWSVEGVWLQLGEGQQDALRVRLGWAPRVVLVGRTRSERIRVFLASSADAPEAHLKRRVNEENSGDHAKDLLHYSLQRWLARVDASEC